MSDLPFYVWCSNNATGDGGSRKKEGPYDKVSEEDVLERLHTVADHAKQYDIDLETGEGKKVELGDCEDFLRLKLAYEDYAYMPPLVAEAMGLGVQEVDVEETDTEDGDRGGGQNQWQVEEELVAELVGVEDLVLDDMGGPRSSGEDVVKEVADPVGEVGAAKTRKTKERVEPACEG
ncbi:hypothetical protein ACLB2K_007219 [Fragaria x ananassa]